MAYFDANATTPLCRAAAEAVAVAERDFWYNPSSPYPAAAATHNQLERARAELAGLLGCAPERIVFNSGASEGAHSLFQYLAKVFGGAANAAASAAANVVISAVEHPCVLQSARIFFPDRVRMLPVN